MSDVKCVYTDSEGVEHTVSVRSIEIEYNNKNPIGSLHGCEIYEWAKPSVVISGLIEEICINDKESDMFEESCSDSRRLSVAKQIADTKKSKLDKWFKEYGVVNDDGSLTEYGEELVLHVLFESNKDSVRKTLEAITSSEVNENAK